MRLGMQGHLMFLRLPEHSPVNRVREMHGPCRFSYIALSCCSLLGRLEAINVPRAVSYVLSCQNFDGGFGSMPGEAMFALSSYPFWSIFAGSTVLKDALAAQATSHTQGRFSAAWPPWPLRAAWASWTATCCAGGEVIVNHHKAKSLVTPFKGNQIYPVCPAEGGCATAAAEGACRDKEGAA